jgi:predicted secreted hydrolase
MKIISAAVALILAVLSSVSASEANDYCQVTGPCNLVFPGDHGSHPCYRTEWWYYTGNLETESSRRFGFQLTFFRTRFVPPGSETEWPRHPSAWRTTDLFFAHAALSDIEGKRFFQEETMSRGAVGLAGVLQEGPSTRVFLGPWSAGITGDTHHLKAASGQFGLDLKARDIKGPVPHGLSGYSRKGLRPESSSCYYSVPRLEVSGTLTLHGKALPVRGKAWMDHEFSSAPLEQDVVGWDWFSIQLSDDTELMIYVLRLDRGAYSPASSGTFVDASGEKIHLNADDFRVEVLDRWKSPKTGAVYPGRWRILVNSLQMDLLITPNLPDQELVTTRTTQVTYWEGSVSVQGRTGQKPLAGFGYVELTGYHKPFRLTPPEEEGAD